MKDFVSSNRIGVVALASMSAAYAICALGSERIPWMAPAWSSIVLCAGGLLALAATHSFRRKIQAFGAEPMLAVALAERVAMPKGRAPLRMKEGTL